MSKAPQPDGTDPFSDNEEEALTEAQAATIEQYLWHVAPMVGLHGWRIHVSTHAAAENKVAEGRIAWESDEVWIAVERGHPEVEEHRRRAVYVHELLHCHIDPPYRPYLRELEERSSPGGWQSINDMGHSQVERSIERLAWAISGYLPPAPEL